MISLAAIDRDEVLAEWLIDKKGSPQLHLFCHISSSHKWSGPIPPALRSRIFQREMPLVRTARFRAIALHARSQLTNNILVGELELQG